MILQGEMQLAPHAALSTHRHNLTETLLLVVLTLCVLCAELTVLGGLVGGVVLLASYTVKKTLLNNESGS